MTTPSSRKSSHAQTQAITSKLRRFADSAQIPFNRALTLFLLERAAHRLTLEPRLAPGLTFKGGFVAVRVYASSRYTKDLDAALRGIDKEAAVQLARAALEKDAGDGVWFQLEKAADLAMQGERGGVRLVFRAGLGEPPAKLAKAQIVELDLAFGGDPVTPAPRALTTPFVIGEGHLTWSVYPLETVLAEKLHALVSRAEGNSRAKDLYDAFAFLPRASPELLAKALASTFAHRQTPLPRPLADALAGVDKTVLRLAWDSAVVAAADAAPPFDDALAAVVEQLNAWEL